MALLDTIPGVEDFIRNRIEQGATHKVLSDELKALYPLISRGLSSRSIRRFCEAHDIHSSSRLSDVQLDTVVRTSIHKVGPGYGRRTMTGLLAADGIRVCQLRVGRALSRIDPINHHRRQTATHRLVNPTPYRSDYFGEKLHIDQNEKLVMFGITHICAVDGHSGKIVAFATMPIKNNALIYEHIYMKLINDYGIWNQIRVDMGREWFLMLYMQERLSQQRYDTTKPAYLQTSSKQNHIVERLWVEINSRVNYPVKSALIDMAERGDIDMTNPLHKFCVSWFSIHVTTAGVKLMVKAWNSHPIPGRRRGGMPSHIPDVVMRRENRVQRIVGSLPSPAEAISLYQEEGGQISDGASFGEDPLYGDVNKSNIRQQSFSMSYPSFDPIFYQLVNSDASLFTNGLKFFIDITYRLSRT